jgi:hypothetical protein
LVRNNGIVQQLFNSKELTGNIRRCDSNDLLVVSEEFNLRRKDVLLKG